MLLGITLLWKAKAALLDSPLTHSLYCQCSLPRRQSAERPRQAPAEAHYIFLPVCAPWQLIILIPTVTFCLSIGDAGKSLTFTWLTQTLTRCVRWENSFLLAHFFPIETCMCLQLAKSAALLLCENVHVEAAASEKRRRNKINAGKGALLAPCASTSLSMAWPQPLPPPPLRRQPGTHPEYTRTHFKNNVLFQQHQQRINLFPILDAWKLFTTTQHLFDLLHALLVLQIAPPVKAAPTSFPLRPRQFPIIPLAVYRILHPFLPVERVSTKNKFISNRSHITLATQNWILFW